MSRLLFIISLPLLLSACREQEEYPDTGSIELRFDNIVGSVSTQILSEQWDETYPYANEFDQSYNLVTVRYIISEVVFEGPNGEYFADELVATTDNPKGYYLIDEVDIASQRIKFEDLPPGTYNTVSFTMGIDQTGVEQGAGIFLDGMFWTWNSGYIALKVEGQSPDSKGESFGDNIDETNPRGFAYHIGGWDIPNNNQRYTLEFEALTVDPRYLPEVHIAMDVKGVFNGQNPVDFSIKNSVHTPRDGFGIAQNLDDLFQIAHVHQ